MESFLQENERILFKYKPSRWDYYVYMNSYMIPIVLGILLIGTVVPICGGVSWEAYFIFVVAIMGLVLLFFGPLYLLGPKPICIVTNMRIYKITARMSCWVFYDEIRDIKLSGAGKKVGTIKIKTKEFDNLDYNLVAVKNPDEVYRLVESAWRGKNS